MAEPRRTGSPPNQSEAELRKQYNAILRSKKVEEMAMEAMKGSYEGDPNLDKILKASKLRIELLDEALCDLAGQLLYHVQLKS
jgi:hypothetical protein